MILVLSCFVLFRFVSFRSVLFFSGLVLFGLVGRRIGFEGHYSLQFGFR